MRCFLFCIDLIMNYRAIFLGYFISMVCALCSWAYAQELPAEFGQLKTEKNIGRMTGLAIPRFVSLKKAPTNIRKGPDRNYPIVWTYKKSGMPVEVVNEFDNWRKIQDMDGSQGWVHQMMLSGKRSIITLEGEHILRQSPSMDSRVIAKLSGGLIAELVKCKSLVCYIKQEHFKGWILKKSLYGVYDEEKF